MTDFIVKKKNLLKNAQNEIPWNKKMAVKQYYDERKIDLILPCI